jgi:hypothetical protein
MIILMMEIAMGMEMVGMTGREIPRLFLFMEASCMGPWMGKACKDLKGIRHRYSIIQKQHDKTSKAGYVLSN